MQTPINDFLEKYKNSNFIRCHMPGHKGQYPFDITEIDGADSLFETQPFSQNAGIIAKSEENATKLFGSVRTYYSCGGSTLAIQAMLALVKAYYPAEKNTIIATRYAHKSLVSTAILLGLDIDWITSTDYLSANISPDAIKDRINEKTLAVFVNSVDYYGGMSDISTIKKACGSVPLLVDNAHGAYLPFTDKGNFHPLNFGADLCADSAHKTLPVLTGGSYLHIGNEKFLPRAKEIMALFGSSSPSYLILQSLDLCNKYLAENNTIPQLCKAVQALKQRLCAINYDLKQSDPMRITINAKSYGYNGFSLADILRENKIECEMSDENYVVLLFGAGTTQKELDYLYKILAEIPMKTPLETIDFSIGKIPAVMPVRSAFFSDFKQVEISKAEGEICAGIIAPCPPCIPLVMCGEVFTKKAVDILQKYGVKTVRIVAK